VARAAGPCVANRKFDMHADPDTGVVSGHIYGQDQIFCGNMNSTEWLVTQYKASNQAGSVPQYYCLNTCDIFNPATSQPYQLPLPPLPPGFTPIFASPIKSQRLNQPEGTKLILSAPMTLRMRG